MMFDSAHRAARRLQERLRMPLNIGNRLIRQLVKMAFNKHPSLPLSNRAFPNRPFRKVVDRA